MVPLALVSEDLTRAREFHQFHGLFFPWLKPHGSSRGDVQPHPARLVTIELQSVVHFEEVIVAADLDRTIAGVPDDHCQGAAATVCVDGLRFEQVLAWGILAALPMESDREP